MMEMTLSYQLVAKSEVYHRVIEDEISCDPNRSVLALGYYCRMMH
jgi:hypothetical protein